MDSNIGSEFSSKYGLEYASSSVGRTWPKSTCYVLTPYNGYVNYNQRDMSRPVRAFLRVNSNGVVRN